MYFYLLMKKDFIIIIIIIIKIICLFRNPFVDYHVINIHEEDKSFILKLNVYYVEVSLNKMVLQ